MSFADIENRFEYHTANAETMPKHDVVRDRTRDLAYDLNVILPEGREKALALTHLEEVMFWANAAIARSIA